MNRRSRAIIAQTLRLTLAACPSIEWCHSVCPGSLPVRAPAAATRCNERVCWVLRRTTATTVSPHPAFSIHASLHGIVHDCVAPQSVYSRSSLPGRLRAESVGRRAPPPPPPTAACQKKLDAFCQNKTEPAMKPCYATKPGTPGYPDYLPLVARDSFGCAEEPPKPWPHGLPQGATQCRHNGCVYYACVLSWCDIIMMTGPCQKALARPGWRCYSALALSPDKSEWSNKAKHPNAYCSEPGSALEAIAKAC